MYCPRCGQDMRQSDRDPRYMVCDNCRKKFLCQSRIFMKMTLFPKAFPYTKSGMPALFISLILTIAYLAYCVYYWCFLATDVGSYAEAIGFNVAHAAVMPHIVATVVAFVFNWVGVVLPNRWFILVGAILYVVGIILFPLYFVFLFLQVILSFVGFGLMVSSRNKQKFSKL